jgi:hypothetical protein
MLATVNFIQKIAAVFAQSLDGLPHPYLASEPLSGFIKSTHSGSGDLRDGD